MESEKRRRMFSKTEMLRRTLKIIRVVLTRAQLCMIVAIVNRIT
jgi:hypothetical protein